MAAEVLLTVSKDEKERAWLESRLKYVLDRQSELYDARTEGLEQGEGKGHLDDARRMKESGYPAEEIQRITGVSFEEIDTL